MKKVIAWLLAIALTAAVSIGATLAYLTDTDEDVNVMTLGNVKIDQLEYERVDAETKNDDAAVQEFHDNKPLYPAVTEDGFDYTTGDANVDWTQIGKNDYTSGIWNPDSINNELDKMVFVKNKGKSDAFVRTIFAFEAGKYTTVDEFKSMMHLNLNETDWTWDWIETPVTIGESTYFVATATYNNILESGKLTEISLSQIALDKTATNADVEAFGETYQILVKTQAIQAQGFDTPAFALDEGFGVVTADSIPWESDNAIQGIDLYTALNYLDGDGTTQITTKVTNITFGLTENYASIADAYAGTLIDVEQDVPVYAYYVPNGNNYDVYVLASDTIYAPTDCSNLCNGMSNLISFDDTNLDLSKTTSLYRMFRDCGKLSQLDVSDWDTSNVTNMRDVFRACKSLPSVDVSNWETGKVETMIAMFQDCVILEQIDVSNWDTSNVTDMTQMFNRCNALKSLDVSGWDTGKVTSMQLMFQECLVLPTVDTSNWETGNVTSMAGMFRGCYGMEELDVSGWDTSKVTTFQQIFASGHQNKGDMKLKSLDVSNWDTSSATVMGSLFYGCGRLTELDLSSWDVSKVTSMSHMFADCFKLQSIDFTGWDTSSLVVMDAIFNDCDSLVTLDVSDFDTHNVKEFSQVFDDCEKLENLIGLSNWNTANGCTFEEMFQGCEKLVSLDLSSFDTRNARDNFKATGDTYDAFLSMFSNVPRLETLIMGENFDFNGNSDSNRAVALPRPAAKDGKTTVWRNVETGQTYSASEIPEGVAATYVAYYEYVATGAKMSDALHYLNADTGSTKITTKVSNVTFGLTKDFANIANNYTAVLADVGQDGPVYAYYVPNGSNYDIYILSNDVIYTPEDSSNLFNGMSNLVSVNTTNLDVSRTKDMTMMFMGCSKLQNIDLSHWDTSNVTSLFATFANCKALTEPAMENWDTSNVTTMRALFSGATNLSKLDASKWDTSKVTAMNNLFNSCSSLTELNSIGNWDTSKVTDMGQMFSGCSNLTSVDVANWDTGSVQLFRGTFRGCINLTQLDVSNWDVSSVLEFNSMFSGDGKTMKLTEIDVSKWNPVSATSTAYMFYGCGNITSFDLSNWTVPNLGNMYHMFTDCGKLVSVDFGVWETDVLWSVDGMFNDCWSLKSVDVSTWNVSNVTEFSQMFESCSSLEAVIGLGNWKTSKGITFEEMFDGCKSLKELDLSGFNTRNSTDGFKNQAGAKNEFLNSFLLGCTSLEKITFGADFSFDGDGTAPAGYVFQMPSATGVAGWDGHWYDAEGNAYAPSKIPEETAATYYAVNPVAP